MIQKHEKWEIKSRLTHIFSLEDSFSGLKKLYSGSGTKINKNIYMMLYLKLSKKYNINIINIFLFFLLTIS